MEIFVGSLLQTDGRLKSTLFYTDDYQHLKTRLLSTDNFYLYRRVQERGEMMHPEHDFLEQFISLTTTKLTAKVYTELSFLFEHQMLHVEANQAITRKRTTNVFTELSPSLS